MTLEADIQRFSKTRVWQQTAEYVTSVAAMAPESELMREMRDPQKRDQVIYRFLPEIVRNSTYSLSERTETAKAA